MEESTQSCCSAIEPGGITTSTRKEVFFSLQWQKHGDDGVCVNPGSFLRSTVKPSSAIIHNEQASNLLSYNCIINVRQILLILFIILPLCRISTISGTKERNLMFLFFAIICVRNLDPVHHFNVPEG